nr:protein IMPACT homolog [Crassostrea gigas]
MEPGIKSNNLRKNSEKNSQQSAAKTQTQTKTNSRQLAKVHTSTQVPLNDPPEVNVTVSRSLKNLISRNSIVLPNGSKYSEETNAAVLKIDQAESEQLDDIVTMNTEPIQKNGSEFYSTGTKVGSVNQAQNFYKKVCINPYVASVDSRILIYRFMEQKKLIENYHDDGEHGAGRRLLKYTRENQIMEVAIVVTRWMGEHIGPQRFIIMEGLVNEVANLVLE